jgi:cell wall-associated NlpC family hydrolase
MTNWYDKYLNIPYKHLGNDPKSGMDCFNLCRYIYKEETGIVIPYLSLDRCNIVDEDWYNKTSDPIFETSALSDKHWESVSEPQQFDFVLMSIGSTNITNHCAMYLSNNKVIHSMINRPSWVSPYGSYYKQYTTGLYRWTT